MSFVQRMKADVAVMLITAPLFFITGLIWFWAVLQFADVTEDVVAFFVATFPFLIAWTIFQRGLSKRLIERWVGRKRPSRNR